MGKSNKDCKSVSLFTFPYNAAIGHSIKVCCDMAHRVCVYSAWLSLWVSFSIKNLLLECCSILVVYIFKLDPQEYLDHNYIT